MNKTFFHSFLPEGVFVIPGNESITERNEPISLDLRQAAAVKKAITYLGENKRKILILVHDREELVNEKDKEFLGKVLGAIRLSFSDVALINSFLYDNLHFSDLENAVSFTKLILFGEEVTAIFNEQQPGKYKLTEREGVETLFSDSLTEIQEDKTKKIKLWEELKKMFP